MRYRLNKPDTDCISKDPLHLAYMAGLIDGEGCFFIGKYKCNSGCGITFHTILNITSADQILVQWTYDHFGGNGDSRVRWTSKRAFERPIYRWIISGDHLTKLCELLIPFLVLKKRHAEVMLEMRKTYKAGVGRGNTKVSPEEWEKRDELMRQLRQLNSRYHNHALKHS